jgi:hypothetical protein
MLLLKITIIQANNFKIKITYKIIIIKILFLLIDKILKTDFSQTQINLK